MRLIKLLPSAGALILTACTYGPGGPPPLTPLTRVHAEPGPALLEHLLSGYFSALPPALPAPTTCASLAPKPVSAAQEKALIARFPRLAPLARCKAKGSGFADAITGDAAQVIQAYSFACTDADNCTAWASVPGQTSARIGMRWSTGEWHFARDARLIAQ